MRIERFAIILGAMSAGAIDLHDCLAAHPQLARCRMKEPGFFGSDKQWARGADFYRGLWPAYDPANHRHALEVSTSYTKQPWHRETAARIGSFARDTGSEFSFLYVVRDPVDRMEAHIAHSIREGRATADAYAHCLEQALNVSRYAFQLDQFRRVLGKPQVLVVDSDAFRKDPDTTLRDCAGFLEIDPEGFGPHPAAGAAGPQQPGFRFSAAERRELQAALLPDMLRLHEDWGFDVSRWTLSTGAAAHAEAKDSNASGLAIAPSPAQTARKASAARPRSAPPAAQDASPAVAGYWNRRQKMMYYQYVIDIAGPLAADARSLIDVGSHGTSMAEEFDWIPERTALDLREPYSSPSVKGIKADFFTFEPEHRYDVALCLQVLEHVPDAGRFARKLFDVADRLVVSVPYMWPKNRCRFHCQDPVDEAKLAGWFGRKPDYTIVVAEPFREAAIARRLIAYFHTPGEKFDLKRYRYVKPKQGRAV